MSDLVELDYMFSCQVIVCDDPFGGFELDRKYSKDGYEYGTIEMRCKKLNGKMSKWEDISGSIGGHTEKVLIFWKGKKPTIDPKALSGRSLMDIEVRIKKQSYGDSFGVHWLLE